MTSENLEIGHLDIQEISRMGMPDLWFACQEQTGPLDELAAARNWDRFFHGNTEDKATSFMQFYQQAPWPRPLSGLYPKGELIFWTWFTLNQEDPELRRLLAAISTIPQGSKITGRFGTEDYAVTLSDAGELQLATAEVYQNSRKSPHQT